MNVRMLKAKRVERNLRQKDLANALGITEKAMCHKECSEENKFKAAEMLTLVDELNLSFLEFDAIFFNYELTECLRRTIQKTNNWKATMKEKGMESTTCPGKLTEDTHSKIN